MYVTKLEMSKFDTSIGVLIWCKAAHSTYDTLNLLNILHLSDNCRWVVRKYEFTPVILLS